MVKPRNKIDAVLFGLFLAGSLAILGGLFSQASAQYNGPRRFALATGPTPTPRPTSIVLSSSSSSACGLSGRYFGDGSACSATETNEDVATTEGGTFTNMTCSQTDTSCVYGFQLRKNAANVSTFQCNATNTTPCSPSSPTSTTFALGDLLAVAVTDVDGNCGTLAPTCTVFYTVP